MVYGARKHAAAQGDKSMDWSRVGRALVQMDVDSLKLVLDSRVHGRVGFGGRS